MGGSQARVRLRYRGTEILQWICSARFNYICTNMQTAPENTNSPIHTQLQEYTFFTEDRDNRVIAYITIDFFFVFFF